MSFYEKKTVKNDPEARAPDVEINIHRDISKAVRQMGCPAICAKLHIQVNLLNSRICMFHLGRHWFRQYFVDYLELNHHLYKCWFIARANIIKIEIKTLEFTFECF